MTLPSGLRVTGATSGHDGITVWGVDAPGAGSALEKGMTAVRWDGQDTVSWCYDSALHHMPLPVDWRQPIELDDGTPLTFRSSTEWHASIRLADYTKKHPAFPSGVHYGEARLLDGLVISNHKYRVRNRNMIDATKRLHLIGGATTDRMEVKLIAVTVEGNLIIDLTGLKKDSDWIVFDRNGKFVKSPTGGGRALSLVNAPDPVTHRFAIVVSNGVPYFSPMDAGGVCDVQIITEDDRIVSVTPRADL